jgi:hypothetical protein
MSKSAANFLHALVAVLAGNAAYLLLEKHLPVGARHVVFKFDWGMVVDFWFCLVAFGIVKAVANWKPKAKPRQP